MPGRMHRTQTFVGTFWKRGKATRLGGHDLVRRTDRQGKVLIWCRKCSGYARQGMGLKLIN